MQKAKFNLYTNQAEIPAPSPHPIKPLGGPFRRWHLTPWQRTQASALLDDLGDYSDDADAWMNAGLNPAIERDYAVPMTVTLPNPQSPSQVDPGVFNSILGAVGQFVGFKSGGVTVAPRPGQIVNSQTASFLQSQNTTKLLTYGAVALGALWFLSKRGK